MMPRDCEDTKESPKDEQLASKPKDGRDFSMDNVEQAPAHRGKQQAPLPQQQTQSPDLKNQQQSFNFARQQILGLSSSMSKVGARAGAQDPREKSANQGVFSCLDIDIIPERPKRQGGPRINKSQLLD
mmetsp:Transcript_13214/g.22415  ORF Transcript_13214/g.22415 Transcript_13214/m.22415 type:complete len:128 (-) Transcript_13214:1863-2246(-)